MKAEIEKSGKVHILQIYICICNICYSGGLVSCSLGISVLKRCCTEGDSSLLVSYSLSSPCSPDSKWVHTTVVGTSLQKQMEQIHWLFLTTHYSYHAIYKLTHNSGTLISKKCHPLNASYHPDAFLQNSLCCPYFCNAVAYSQAHHASVRYVLLNIEDHFAPWIGYCTTMACIVRTIQRVLLQWVQTTLAVVRSYCFKLGPN